MDDFKTFFLFDFHAQTVPEPDKPTMWSGVQQQHSHRGGEHGRRGR